jgi:predicted ATP-grasp superfamily ATP-dependent carboligase
VTSPATPRTPADGGRVLVLDADGQCGLAVVRSLGRAGLDVVAGAPTRRSLGGLSRWSAGTYRHPPLADGEAFLDDLLGHLDATRYDAVFAPGDASSSLLARHKPRVEACGPVLAVEDWARYRLTADKAAFFDPVADLDVPTPETHAPTSLAAVDRLADRLDYPVVVKPRSKSVWTADGRHRYALVDDENYADSPDALRRTYRRLCARSPVLRDDPPLVQAYVPGDTTATVVLADRGTVVRYFQEERLRTYPASGGNSALLAPVRSRRMLAYTERVVAALDWNGPAMVEFMRRPDGEYVVIEVNGRYWGSLPVALTAGVDVPALHYRLLCGERPDPAGRGVYRTDFRQRRLFYEDCRWLVERLGDGDVGALVPFLTTFVTASHTFVSPSDPLPTLGALAGAGSLGVRLAAGRLGRAGRSSTDESAVG